jgi:hypothetical protein
MSLYARSDLMSISVPVTSGGCGSVHTRPVSRGVPARTWKLDCDKGCESYLRGDAKMKIIKVIPGDKEQGIPGRMEHHINKVRTEKGAQELQYLAALGQLKQMGIAVPDNAMWLLERTFDPRIVKGSVVCPDGHENAAGTKFCGECGVTMNTKGAIAPVEELPGTTPLEDIIPLRSLHIATLRKRCREKGLDDKGTKDQLIFRLET